MLPWELRCRMVVARGRVEGRPAARERDESGGSRATRILSRAEASCGRPTGRGVDGEPDSAWTQKDRHGGRARKAPTSVRRPPPYALVVLHRTRLASSTVSPLRRAPRETSLPASNAHRRRIKTSGIHSQGSHFEKGSCVRARSAQELPGGLGELARTFSHHGKQAVPSQFNLAT